MNCKWGEHSECEAHFWRRGIRRNTSRKNLGRGWGLLDWYCMTLPTIYQLTALQCTEGDVTLLDGYMEYEGRVEICYGGQWVTVCRYSYGILPEVVCRQLTGSNASKFCYRMSVIAISVGAVKNYLNYILFSECSAVLELLFPSWQWCIHPGWLLLWWISN